MSVTLTPCWVLKNNTIGDSGWKVRLAGTLRQDFIFFYTYTLHSKFPNPPSVDVSGPFQQQGTKNAELWTGRYRTYFTVISDYRPLECIYSHVRHQGYKNAFPVIICGKLAIRINPWYPSPWRSRQEDVQIQEENRWTRMRCEVNIEQHRTWNY